MEENKKPERKKKYKRRYFEDREGDRAKRVTSTVFLISTVAIGALVAVSGIFLDIKSPELIKFVFGGMLGGCLLSLGYTIPELFKDITKNSKE